LRLLLCPHSVPDAFLIFQTLITVNTCRILHPTRLIRQKEQTVLTLADWYHLPAPQASKNPPVVFDSTLINGLGRYPGGPLSDLAVINVSHGKRYRY
jgi:hypothetical protein